MHWAQPDPHLGKLLFTCTVIDNDAVYLLLLTMNTVSSINDCEMSTDTKHAKMHRT